MIAFGQSAFVSACNLLLAVCICIGFFATKMHMKSLKQPKKNREITRREEKTNTHTHSNCRTINHLQGTKKCCARCSIISRWLRFSVIRRLQSHIRNRQSHGHTNYFWKVNHLATMAIICLLFHWKIDWSVITKRKENKTKRIPHTSHRAPSYRFVHVGAMQTSCWHIHLSYEALFRVSQISKKSAQHPI